MKRQLQYQWTLASRCIIPIQMTHPNMRLWISVDTCGGITAVGIYDCADLEAHDDVAYEVRMQPDGSFAGEVRPILVTNDQVLDTSRSKATWMTPDNKEAMLGLMRRALSFRSCPLPTEFSSIWEKTHRIVSELDIINQGLVRYTD